MIFGRNKFQQKSKQSLKFGATNATTKDTKVTRTTKEQSLAFGSTTTTEQSKGFGLTTTTQQEKTNNSQQLQQKNQMNWA